MAETSKTYSLLRGRFVITADACHRLNLIDVYGALLRHACGRGIGYCPLERPGARPSIMACCRQSTVHRDRHGTAFSIVTEADLSRTAIGLDEQSARGADDGE